MSVFVSTTWLGSDRTDVAEVLEAMDGIAADGLEIGSTHRWREDLAAAICDRWGGGVMTHNYFPPARDGELILNLASDDESIRSASIDHCRECLRFASNIGAAVYTVHPGYVVEPEVATLARNSTNFDFVYSDRRTGHDVALRRMNDALKDLAETAAACGVTLAVETQGSVTNPDVTLLERLEDYDYLDEAIAINFNLAHSAFAARSHGFDIEEFFIRYRDRFVAAELSHNDGTGDQHRPLTEKAAALDWAPRLGDIPMVLEFRDATRTDLDHSISLLQTALTKECQRT